MRVFFDASVIIAAILSPTGGSSLLFQYIQLDTIQGITSQTAIEEVLSKTEKLHKSKEALVEFIEKSGLVIRESITEEEIRPYENKVDQTDAHIIAGAILTKCTYLVTLDKKHLLRSDIKGRFLPMCIVTPKELLEEFVSLL